MKIDQNQDKPNLTNCPGISNVTPFRHTSVRFVVLILLSFVLFANQYTFNNPQALQFSIQSELNINEPQFNMLYTIIALPNLFFAICIGVVIDYFGIRKSFVVLSLGLPLFQFIVALGGVYQSYELMLVGRFLFGLIYQSIQIAQACFIAEWFMGKQLAFALGLGTTLPQLGNASNSFFTPIIFQKTQKLGPPLFTSVGVCLLAFVCGCIATYLDMKAEQVDRANNIRLVADGSELQQTFKFADLKSLKPTYWLVAFLCMFAVSQYIPFLDNANKLLQVRFCYSQVTAGRNITVTYLVVGIFGIPLGWFVDKVGFKRYFAIVGMSVFAIGHFIILLFPQCIHSDIITEWSGVSWAFFLLGIGFCFYANCLLPSIALVVKKNVTGTAFGIMQMLQTLGMGAFPLLTGVIIQQGKTQQIGYRHYSLFFFVIGLLGVLISLLFFFINDKDKRILDARSDEKKMVKIPFEYIKSDSQDNPKIKKMEKGYATQNDHRYNHFESQKSDSGNQSMTKLQIQLARRRQSRTSSLKKSGLQSKRAEKQIEREKKCQQGNMIDQDSSLGAHLLDQVEQTDQTGENKIKIKIKRRNTQDFLL